MAAAIQLTGITASDPRPGNYLQVNFAVGAAAGFQGTRALLLIGNMLATGTDAVAARLYGPISTPAVQTEDDVIARFGAGSELHRMFLHATRANQTTPIYCLPVTQSAGAAATLAITVTGTATAPGTVRVRVGTGTTDVPYATGDAAATVAAAIGAAINANTRWAVTAATTGGTTTLTAKQAGLRGNFLRASAMVLQGAGLTVTPTTQTNFTGGTTEDDWTTALTTIATRNFYYQASASNTAGLTALMAQVQQQQLPVTGLRQRVFAGASQSPAAAITITTTLNAARGEMVHCEDSDWTPAEMAAHAAAVYALEEMGTVPRHNFSGYGRDPDTALVWQMPAPSSGKAPTSATILALLNNGVTPIGVTDHGGTYIIKRITMRSLNGANPDYRIRDSHRVTEMDFFGDDLLAKLNLQFSGCDLFDDPPQGQPPPASPRYCSPMLIRNAISRLLDDYATAGRIKNVDRIKAQLVVQRSTGNSNTVEIRIPFQNVDILDKTLTAEDQVA